MKISEFIALIAANANKTSHIRVYSGAWYTGVSRVPDELTMKIGKVITLLQAKINAGQLCNKENECLLIYNFQAGTIHDNYLYCHIDMLVKPIVDIHKTKENIGRPLQLAVDGVSGHVTNNTKSMMDLGLISEEEANEEGLEPPIIYGSYRTYNAICCFAALVSYKPILDNEALFNGEYDHGESVQNSKAFDSLIEARSYLANKKELGRYILEITAPKEDYPYILKFGLSKQLIKIINYFDMSVTVTSTSGIKKREDKINDQLEILKQVKLENSSPVLNRTILVNQKSDEEKKHIPPANDATKNTLSPKT